MNSTVLKAAAACWLRYDRGVSMVTFERGIGPGNPDVLGVDKNRFLIEIECKISFSDFKADAKKYKWVLQEKGYAKESTPRLFYYLVPKNLVEKITPELRPGHGLLTLGKRNWHNGIPEVISVITAKPNKDAKRLSPYSVGRLVKHQTGTLCHLAAVHAAAHLKDYEDAPA